MTSFDVSAAQPAIQLDKAVRGAASRMNSAEIACLPWRQTATLVSEHSIGSTGVSLYGAAAVSNMPSSSRQCAQALYDSALISGGGIFLDDAEQRRAVHDRERL